MSPEVVYPAVFLDWIQVDNHVHTIVLVWRFLFCSIVGAKKNKLDVYKEQTRLYIFSSHTCFLWRGDQRVTFSKLTMTGFPWFPWNVRMCLSFNSMFLTSLWWELHGHISRLKKLLGEVFSKPFKIDSWDRGWSPLSLPSVQWHLKTSLY